MTVFKEFLRVFYSSSFWVIFFLTIFLYGFSTRFNIVFYLFPVFFILAYLLYYKNYKLTLSNESIIFYFLLGCYGLFLAFGGILGLDFTVRIKTSLYVFCFFIPISFIFYQEIKNNGLHNTYKNLLVSYLILGLVLFILYKQGIIASNRYQNIGNCLAATIILIFGIKRIRIRWVLLVLWICFMLLTGSRQALVGLIFCGIIYVFITNYKVFLYFVFSFILGIINSEIIFEKLKELGQKYNANTINRMVYAIENNGGQSLQIRIDIYKRLFNEISFLPNLAFSPNSDHLLPHNFFLEYFIICGYFFGIFFLLFILTLMFRAVLKRKHNVLVYFSIFYFMPFNISSGISAAKYFLFFILLIIVIHEKTKLNEKDTISKH